jgi:MerR family transcriptional regulator, Zn(II)-responsive regulator of zntA
MKIKDFANKYQIQTDTIRYYEKENLLNPIRRENGYREFGDECEKQIRLIVVLKQLGFTIKEIQQYLYYETTNQYQQSVRMQQYRY